MPSINSDRIIDEIEKRNVVPLPRWHFILKRSLFWMLAAISVMTGAIAMVTAIYVFFDNEYITDHAGIEELFAERPFIQVFVQSIPTLWLTAMTLFTMTAYYGFRHTRKGYRYPTLRVIAGSLLLSVLLCGVMNAFDTGRLIHRYLIENVKGYGRLAYTNEVGWAQMEKGVLGGKVVACSVRERMVVIRDYRGSRWNVDISRADLHPETLIKVGSYLKITGIKTGASRFRATTITPWVKKRGKQQTPMLSKPSAEQPLVPQPEESGKP